MSSPHLARHVLIAVPVIALLLPACGGGRAPSTIAAPVVAPATPAPVDSAALSRDRARALLERSATALGGREAVLALPGFELALEARALRGNWAQARRWTDSTPNPVPTIVHYLVDLERGRATYEFLSTSPGEIRFNYRSGYDSSGSWQVDLMRWRLGDDLLRDGPASARANLASIARFLPQGAVRQALLQGDSLRWVGTRVHDGRPTEVVSSVERASGQRVELAVDAATALPRLVTAGGTSYELDDYRAVDGLPIPHLRRQRVGGQLASEQRVTRVVVHPVGADERFAPPPGFAPPPPPGDPRATRVAEGVWRLDGMPGGYHSAFVVGADGVTVLEAPSSVAYAQAALRVIGETAPGRPIARVLVTHHHSDHVAGLAPFVARGVMVVVGAGLEEAVRRQLPDSLRSRARFDTVGASRTFGTGAGRVVALPVPNTHADGNLAFYLPTTRVLFQGDLFYIPERGAVPPAFGVTQSLVDVVRARRLRVDHVVGVHGRTGTWAEVEVSLRRRQGPAPAR